MYVESYQESRSERPPRTPVPKKFLAAAVASIALIASIYYGTHRAGTESDGSLDEVSMSDETVQTIDDPSQVDISRRHTSTALPHIEGLTTTGRYGNLGAKRTSFANVLAHGHTLPEPDKRCRSIWRSESKSGSINWNNSNYFCMPSALFGNKWTPQGMAGTATAEGYIIGETPAEQRKILLTSWYSRSRERGLYRPNDGATGRKDGPSVTRLTAFDLDQSTYSNIELVKACENKQHRPIEGKLCKLDAHGGGLAWAGRYLYLTDYNVMYMFNADDLLQIRGKTVLPAVSKWTAPYGGARNPEYLSSISVDTTTDPNQLVTTGYNRIAPTRVWRFDMTPDGRLAQSAAKAGMVTLRNSYGELGHTAGAVSRTTINTLRVQGAAGYNGTTMVNSSGAVIGGRKNIDALFVVPRGGKARSYRMPSTDVESLYFDQHDGYVWTVNEHDPKGFRGRAKLMYSLPLSEILKHS